MRLSKIGDFDEKFPTDNNVGRFEVDMYYVIFMQEVKSLC
jgi:hypothetical protein